MAYLWRFTGGPMMAQHWMLAWYVHSFVIFQGIRTSIAKKLYIFVIFHGVPDPLSPPLDPHMECNICVISYFSEGKLYAATVADIHSKDPLIMESGQRIRTEQHHSNMLNGRWHYPTHPLT